MAGQPRSAANPWRRGREKVGPIRVMVVDDQEIVRHALISLLDDDEDISVVGSGQDAEEAIAIAATQRPDVALLDVRMPGGGGPRAAREIVRVSPATELIALSVADDAADIRAMLRAGASTYLVKGDGTGEIVDAIHRCVEGADGRTRLAALLPSDARSFGSRERLRRIEAVVRGEGVEIVYQPVFDLTDGGPVGAEALARFTAAPVRGPDVWFEEAAHVGLGIELEVTAVALAVRGLDTLDPSMFLGVNVSPETCCSSELRELLEPLPAAARIVLEITEHAPVTDYERLGAALAPLRDRGVRLAIDDTCSGFASLRHVLHLRPDTIKLDFTLTRGIESDGARRSLVEALVGFAPSVGANVLAEGIETPEQLGALVESGVSLGQGYYLGRPAPLLPSGIWPVWGGATSPSRKHRALLGPAVAGRIDDGERRSSGGAAVRGVSTCSS
jgi:EAL domain-containing protein (putative c-di-GMP-specific phosphodiesterase class I)/CheY-like chemotaxis protein